MVHDSIELVDKGYVRIPLIKSSRKIKSKQSSFQNFKLRWKNYRLKKLQEQLATKKEKLVEMQFSEAQAIPGKEHDRAEKKVLRKTQAIARLESKISFLETGSYLNNEFVDSRAIKLKDLMMKNLVYNRDAAYSVTSEVAEQIVSGETKPPLDKAIDEESAKIDEKVREILAEKKAKEVATKQQELTPASVAVEPVVPTKPESTVSREDIAAAVNEEFAKQIVPTVKKDEIKETIGKEMDKIEVTPIVSSDAVAEAIQQEMDKIKVSNNGSSAAKVNKYINEDGTYRMKREDIDEDFRITRFDRSKLPTIQETPVDVKTELDIPPFNPAMKRKTPDIELPRKDITAISEKQTLKLPEIVLPTIKEQPVEKTIEQPVQEESTQNVEREVPVVVPERRQKVHVTVKKKAPIISETADIPVSTTKVSGDLGNLMARVSLLKAEKKTIDSKAEDAEKKVQSVNEEYQQTMRQLSKFADSLEEDCTAKYTQVQQAEREAAAKEAQINAMLSMMEAGMSEGQEESKRRTR